MVAREPQEKEVHDRAVVDIAKARFDYSNTSPTWRTYVNEPKPMKGIPKNSRIIYPDIVVFDTRDDSLQVVAEIETESSVNQEETTQWSEYSSVTGRFFLYVPKGFGLLAKGLLVNNNISYAGLREYSYDSEGKLSVVKVQ